VKPSGPFLYEHAPFVRPAVRVIKRMPPLSGAPVRIQHSPGLSDRRGPVHAGAFLRQRRVAFDCTRAEFPRIFAHEVAHFIWLRLGNPARRSWEGVLRAESAPGELGWSAEWRKAAITRSDRTVRTRRWREYCCEAFCDTAAWLWSGTGQHAEFTLPARWRAARRSWFAVNLANRTLSI
jgi:hypothetical protein